MIRRPWTQALLILAVSVAVFWWGLGASGLSMSEGHRVLPGWSMLRSGDWVVPRLFEQAYVRKPPGMPWAVAASAAVLGESEFSARTVSALASTLAALACWWAATRWFGSPWGLAAGLVHALTPLWWSPGRSAEIEALHNLCCLCAVLLTIGVVAHTRGRGAWVGGVAVGLAAAGMLLTKGPAGLPALSAALLAAWVSTRAPARRWAPGLLVPGLAIPAGVFGGYLWLLSDRLANTGETPVTQGPGEFLWDSGRLVEIALLPLIAWSSALPASLGVLFPWGPDARRELDPRLPLARAVALAVLLGLAAYTVIGVANTRYTMPALLPSAVLAAYVARGAFESGAFTEHRARIARTMSLGKPWTLPVVLLVAAVVFGRLTDASRLNSSGRAAGQALAEQLAPLVRERGYTGVVVRADGLVEARPEVLESARRAAARLGYALRPVWAPLRGSPPSAGVADPGWGVVTMLRTDGDSDESRYAPVAAAGDLWGEPVASVKVWKYRAVGYLWKTPETRVRP